MRVRFLFILLLPFFLGSCPRNKVEEKEPPGEFPEDNTTAIEPSTIGGFSGPVPLQSRKALSYRLPENAMVGPFLDPLSPNRGEGLAYSLLTNFWRSAMRGEKLEDYFAQSVHPLMLEEVERFAGPMGEVRSIYLGSYQRTGRNASTKVLLLSSLGFIQGDMYLVEDSGGWLIEDWEIPFQDWPGKPLPGAASFTDIPPLY